MATPIELKPGIRVSFRDGDNVLTGSINGNVWSYAYERKRGKWSVATRIPVFVEGRGPIDVAGSNVLTVEKG